MHFYLRALFLALTALTTLADPLAGLAQQEYGAIDIGSSQLQTLYVDPVAGADDNSGASAGLALRTITAAWNKIPSGTNLTVGYRILMLPGAFEEDAIPNYWESKYGTADAPIIFEAAEGVNTVTWRGDANIFDVRHLYLINFSIIPDPAGDALHCERCSNLLLRGMTLNGAGQGTVEAHETLKVNQSDHIYIERSDISGANDNAIDFVAVQYGHLLNSRVHNSADWCMYAKGGSAYLRVEGNEFYDCGTGGFTAGQGTGFEFMTTPWLHYEASDIKFVNNIIHDTEGAGFGVNGGYNILLAHNTLYRVGSRSHLIEVVYGLRSCDGDSTTCAANRALGGWGPAALNQETVLGNRNVYIYNNLVYNPAPFESADQHLAIYGPRTPLAGTNLSSPQTTDTALKIAGNLLWNGSDAKPLGIEEIDQGCQSSNASCNSTQLLADNLINSTEPELSDPSEQDFRPSSDSNLLSLAGQQIPDFSGGDRPSTPLAPEGTLTNSVTRDRGGIERTAIIIGAYTGAQSPLLPDLESEPSIPLPPAPTATPGFGAAPTVSQLKVRTKRVSSRQLLFTISASVTGQSSIVQVSASIKAKGSARATSLPLTLTSGASYSGKKKVRAARSFTITVTALDAAEREASKSKKVTVR